MLIRLMMDMSRMLAMPCSQKRVSAAAAGALTAYMGFALHFHLRHLKDPLMSLVLQLLLFRTPRARECAQ